MSISRRILTRAGVLAVGALTLASCSDSSTSPLQVTPDVLQTMGENVATEIESSIASLTAQDVMNSTAGAPTFRLVPKTGASMLRGLSFSRTAAEPALKATTEVAQCGVASQSPPVDTDGDNVPDNWSMSFALPACHFVDQTSATSFDVTGVLRISDPQPGTAGLALNFGLDNFKVTFSGTDGSGYVSRNGNGTVDVSASGLSQTENWTEAAVLTGITSGSATVSWSGTFVPAQGQSLVAGRALPDGAYSPNGSFTLREGNRAGTFSITTIEPLQYSAACAGGTGVSPFTSGHIRVAVSSQQNSGYADVTYSGCNSATVTLVSQ